MRLGRRAFWGVLGAAGGTLAGVLAMDQIRRPVVVPVDQLPKPVSWGVPTDEPVVQAAPKVRFETATAAAIPVFGQYPWRRVSEPMGADWEIATRLALQKMGLPAGARDKAVQRLRAVDPDEFIAFTNTHGFSSKSKSYFKPAFDTTWRHGDRWVLARGSTTNFRSDLQTEQALLYWITDGGSTWACGMFLACGNVSLFTPAVPGWVPPAPRPEPDALLAPQGHGGFLPPFIGPGGLFDPGPFGPGPQPVPEPGILALVAVAAAGLFFRRKK